MLKILFFSVFFCTLANGQETLKEHFNYQTRGPIGIDFSTGLFNKFRFRVEYRINQNTSILGSFAAYYGLNPGRQLFLEGRKYFNQKQKSELYVYGKVGHGISTTYNGQYGLIGLGFGQRIYPFKKQSFYLQFNQGVKYCQTISGNVDIEPGSGFSGLFYLIGPGSMIDLNISIGWLLR